MLENEGSEDDLTSGSHSTKPVLSSAQDSAIADAVPSTSSQPVSLGAGPSPRDHASMQKNTDGSRVMSSNPSDSPSNANVSDNEAKFGRSDKSQFKKR